MPLTSKEKGAASWGEESSAERRVCDLVHGDLTPRRPLDGWLVSVDRAEAEVGMSLEKALKVATRRVRLRGRDKCAQMWGKTLLPPCRRLLFPASAQPHSLRQVCGVECDCVGGR